MKYHINSKGDARPCTATSSPCPYGSEDHFGTLEEAREAFEARQSSFRREIEWGEESNSYSFTSSRTPGGKIEVQVSDKLRSGSTTHGVEVWLSLPDEGNVAFVSLLRHTEEYYEGIPTHLVLCDIEVRVDQRGRGRAREVLESIEDQVGLPLYGSGSFTPEGWEALGEHITYYPHVAKGSLDEAGVKFSSMGFVASWKNKVPRYPSNHIDYTEEQRDSMYELSEAGVFRRMQDKEILWVEE